MPPPSPSRRPARHRGVAAVLLLVLLPVLAGCRESGAPVAAGTSPGEAPPAAAPRRVVSLSPNTTAILLALGRGGVLVGVDDFSRLPPELAAVPRLGGYHDPDLERIVTLAPELAVLLAGQVDLAIELERLGVEVLAVENESLADVEASVRALGVRLGAQDAAAAVLHRFREGLAPRPVAAGRRVLLAIAADPQRLGEVLVAGPGSFHHEMLERLGANNSFAELPQAYAPVGLEEVVARRPEAVLSLHGEELTPQAREALERAWREALPGAGRVAVIAGPDVLIPGPHLPAVYARMAEALE
ncbi:MAG TPA: helical backbone metal receptor [Thermoanaerobaculia bacterium]|nr:helical backbone metal receptor [Thermoanaerobaculia bacterium]